MTIFTAYYSVNMDNSQVWYGSVTKATSNQIQVTSGSYVQNYYGSFTYSGNYLTGGTVTSTNFYVSGTKIYQITGGSFNAVTVANYAFSGNVQASLGYIFAGADRFNGSSQVDRLNGYAGNDQLYGNGGNDVLKGGTGNDFIDGGTGSDSLIGGLGNDLYLVNLIKSVAGAAVLQDSISELVSQGTDTLRLQTSASLGLISYATLTLAANLENLDVSLTGNNKLNLTGNTSANVLTGNSVANVVNGLDGADRMIGGNGSDLYYVDNAGDVVVETNASSVTGGTDIVYSYRTAYSLGNYVENGRIITTVAANLTGNTLANSLAGNAANNVLNGLGGVDHMTGGNGSDSYYVDNVGDVVTETNTSSTTGGIDIVYSYLVAYTLGANVENGRILNTGSANLTGNGLNNLLYAGSGVNVIDGGTGVSDTVSYQFATTAGSSGVTLNLSVVNGAGQSIASGISGADRIKNVENITGSSYADTLTGSQNANVLDGRSGNDKLIGLSGNDILVGGAGNDVLVGGVGRDLLTGGTDNDIFDFNALSDLGLGIDNRDVITDFDKGLDKIDLSTIDIDSIAVGDQAFILIDPATAFSAVGEIHYDSISGIIAINTDTDIEAEYEIQLTGTLPAELAGTDLVL